jgi:hypothetical protein
MWTFSGFSTELYYPLAIAIFFATAAYFHLSNQALNSVKGPLLAKWSRLWMVRHSRRGDMHRVMIHLHEKHGSLVRTGPNEVSVSEPSVVRTIYGWFLLSLFCFHFQNAYFDQVLVPSFARVIGIAYGKVVVPSIYSQSGTKVSTRHSEDWSVPYILWTPSWS